MTKGELIILIEKLQTKSRSLGHVKGQLTKSREIHAREDVARMQGRIQSICQRLALNFNMLPNPQAAEFLENTIAEAELELAA